MPVTKNDYPFMSQFSVPENALLVKVELVKISQQPGQALHIIVRK